MIRPPPGKLNGAWAANRSSKLPTVVSPRGLAGVWLRVARHLAAPFFQRPHGARGNIISELWLFHPTWWRRAFREDGFELIRDEPMGLFYTGHMTFGSGLPLARREKLAKVLGSACHLYQMQPNSALRALHQGPTSAEDAVTPHPAVRATSPYGRGEVHATLFETRAKRRSSG